MTKTENYNLNQWVPEDPVRRTDFNEDNAKLDAALKAQADALDANTQAWGNAVAAEAQARQTLAAQVAARGNCQIVTGSYTGTGTYGASNAKTLTFSRPPLLVFVYAENTSGRGYFFTLVRGVKEAGSNTYIAGVTCYISWPGNSVSWYHTSDASIQLNHSGTTYYYVALLTAG